MAEKTIYQHLKDEGVSRREFMKLCGILAGAMGLEFAPPVKALAAAQGADPAKMVAHALKTKPRVPIIWLELQDCAGCTEAISRSLHPTLANLVLNKISLDYQETLMAAAGFQAEESKKEAMKKYHGKYVLVVEGSPSIADDGVYCTIGGRSNMDILKEAAEGAAAIISTGNCASFGGIPKAKPNPTTAKGVWEVITEKPVLNIPGCPAIPEVTTGTIVYFLVFGKLPELDSLNRPMTYYGNTIHDRCLRRPFYEDGKFANSFDDEGARLGYCLYKLGCKGPTTYNACASLKWDGGLSFPIQSGHPCLGCSQPNFWDGGGFYEGQSAPLDRPEITAVGAAAGIGVAIGAAMVGANRIQKKNAEKQNKSAE